MWVSKYRSSIYKTNCTGESSVAPSFPFNCLNYGGGVGLITSNILNIQYSQYSIFSIFNILYYGGGVGLITFIPKSAFISRQHCYNVVSWLSLFIHILRLFLHFLKRFSMFNCPCVLRLYLSKSEMLNNISGRSASFGRSIHLMSI